MNLQDDDFTLLGLPRTFALDRALLDARWKAMQAQTHPDKFATEGAAAQRVAMQWSVRLNEAYSRLKNPLTRAAYLCELAGAPVQAHSNTAMPAAFLVQQMEWREALEDADDATDVECLMHEVEGEREQLLRQVAEELDVHHTPTQAVQTVRALMFLDKFGRDLDDALARYE